MDTTAALLRRLIAQFPTNGVTANGSKPFVNEKIAAEEFLGISAGALRDLRVLGVGPRYFRIGLRRIFYRPSDLEAWIATRENAPPATSAPAVEAIA
jgi:hypothetical protein